MLVIRSYKLIIAAYLFLVVTVSQLNSDKKAPLSPLSTEAAKPKIFQRWRPGAIREGLGKEVAIINRPFPSCLLLLC